MVEGAVALLEPAARHADRGVALHQRHHVVERARVDLGVRVEHEHVGRPQLPEGDVVGDAEAGVPVERVQPHLGVLGADHLRRAVGAGVVDDVDEHLATAVGVLPERPQAGPQQLQGPGRGDDHDLKVRHRSSVSERFVAERHDIAVVGGGILGLAVARELTARRPGSSVCVLEREAEIGTHQTGHNSGVIHAGIYYAPGSLKAELCVRGAAEMYEYCEQRGIPFERCGKLIVASTEAELAGLDELERRGRANGVPGLRRLDADGIREVEPHATGVAALHSPETGIVDFRAVARAYADDLLEAGGEIATGCEVSSLDPGHGALRIAPLAGGDRGPPRDLLRRRLGRSPRGRRRRRPRPAHRPLPRRLPAAGARAAGAGPLADLPGPRPLAPLPRRPPDQADRRRGPDRADGAARSLRAGPHAGLARLLAPLPQMVADGAGGDPPRGLGARPSSRPPRATSPSCAAPTSCPPSPACAPRRSARDGGLVDDFVFSATERALHVRNAPSPGATSSLAIAARIADQAERAF